MPIFVIVLLLLVGCSSISESTYYIKQMEEIKVLDIEYNFELALPVFKTPEEKWRIKDITHCSSTGEVIGYMEFVLDQSNILWKVDESGNYYKTELFDSTELWKESNMWETIHFYDDNGVLVEQISRREFVETCSSKKSEEIGRFYTYSILSEEAVLHVCFLWNEVAYFDGRTVTTMEITALDSVGSGTVIEVSFPHCFIADNNGNLSYIAEKIGDTYAVIKCDLFGRPMWIAYYDMNGVLSNYFLYEYQAIGVSG